MKNAFKTTLGALAIVAVSAVSGNAAVVLNGSFEQDAGLAQDGQAFSTLVSGTGSNSWSVFSSLPGWTTVSGAGIEIQTKNTLSTIDPIAGDHYVELDSNNNSSMKQTIQFDSIGRYMLSFLYSPRDNNTASNVIDYSIANLSGSVSGPSSNPLTQVGSWTKITALFDITQIGAYDLKFTANGTNNSLGGFIDDVSISAVPLPAGGVLLLTAFAGFAALRRRKAA